MKQLYCVFSCQNTNMVSKNLLQGCKMLQAHTPQSDPV